MRIINKVIFFIPVIFFLLTSKVFAAPTIGTITDSGTAGKYQKFEITFPLTTAATNLQWPYDAAAPAGVTSGVGVTVNAVFTDPLENSYTQPAFYFQPYSFTANINGSGRDWIYPQGTGVWKVRFAPTKIGTWSYKIIATDSTGTTETATKTFTVTDSTGHGFVRVSKMDTRYFEFEDGTYFPGLGYNMSFDHVDWVNPVTENKSNFQLMGQNGIQMVRMWLSAWSMFGINWSPWHYVGGGGDGAFITGNNKYADHDVAYYLDQAVDPCMSSGHWLSPQVPLKQNTNYRVRARVKFNSLTGPRVLGGDWGLVAKISRDGNSWLDYCYNSGSSNGERVGTNYFKTTNNNDWETVNFGTFNSGSLNFLTSFNLALENVSSGKAYVDYIWVEEDLGSNLYGPNVLIKPGMNQHQYFDEHMAAAFDKLVELAEQNGVYLKTVILEKEDNLLWQFDLTTGNYLGIDCYSDKQTCWSNFYGNGREMTKVRWLQRAWWRYLQARWGYSTVIHSWELLNEGDPYNDRHAVLTDEFAKYMHQFKPNDHMASTSNWNTHNKNFWDTASNADFTDVHKYGRVSGTAMDMSTSGVDTGFIDSHGNGIYIDAYNSNDLYDTAEYTQKLSMYIGAKQQYGLNKPVVRGETGFVGTSSTDDEITSFDGDIFGTGTGKGGGIWLHNYIWGQINPGGLMELYWYESFSGRHIYGSKDQRGHFEPYYKFIKDIPLNKGGYVDAAATTTNGLRAWGQKNVSKKLAHVWVQNPNHNWNNYTPAAMTGTVTITGLPANSSIKVEQWNTYAGAITSTSNMTTNSSGALTISVSGLVDDTAFKIGDYITTVDKVDILDIRAAIAAFQNIFAINSIIASYGK